MINNNNNFINDGDEDDEEEEDINKDYEEEMRNQIKVENEYLDVIEKWDRELVSFPEELWYRCRPNFILWTQFVNEGGTVENYRDFFWRLPKEPYQNLLNKKLAERLRREAYYREKVKYGE